MKKFLSSFLILFLPVTGWAYLPDKHLHHSSVLSETLSIENLDPQLKTKYQKLQIQLDFIYELPQVSRVTPTVVATESLEGTTKGTRLISRCLFASHFYLGKVVATLFSIGPDNEKIFVDNSEADLNVNKQITTPYWLGKKCRDDIKKINTEDFTPFYRASHLFTLPALHFDLGDDHWLGVSSKTIFVSELMWLLDSLEVLVLYEYNIQRALKRYLEPNSADGGFEIITSLNGADPLRIQFNEGL